MEGQLAHRKIYDLDIFEKLLEGVQVASCMISETPLIVDEESVVSRVGALTLGSTINPTSCSSCNAGPFESRQQQIAHYKHHWHTHNLKRKLLGRPAVTLHQFSTRDDDNSSISGSESDVDDKGVSDLFAAATRHCKAFFTNKCAQVFCVYRCLLHHKKEAIGSDGLGIGWVNACINLSKPGKLRWAIIMVAGGHFAGAIFSGGIPVIHKTLHSYVVRRGQGHAQGTRDNQGNAPKSAGASLRRYNQAQFAQHIQDILTSWSEDLSGCSLVLYRAVGPINRAVLFGKGSPLVKDDNRMRALPFPTRKPSFKEVQRAHSILSTLEIYDTTEAFQKALSESFCNVPSSSATQLDRSRKSQKPNPSKPIDRAKSREPINRPLPPLHQVSSEDDGPCFEQPTSPPNWTKTLSEHNDKRSSRGKKNSQATAQKNGPVEKVVVNLDSIATLEDFSMSGTGKKHKVKKHNKQKADKVPNNIQKLWDCVSSGDKVSLETIQEAWEGPINIQDAYNMPDPKDGNTALHKASIASSPDIVTHILSSGGDPCIRNHQQQTPYVAADHQDTRIAFRLFQGEFPDRHNYSKAHIPGPLTLEIIEQEKEKKTARLKAKRQREKEKLAEKSKMNKFIELTDTEKIKATGESRCFTCGASVDSKPFQYEVFKFCTIKCLQAHRNARPLHLSTQ